MAWFIADMDQAPRAWSGLGGRLIDGVRLVAKCRGDVWRHCSKSTAWGHMGMGRPEWNVDAQIDHRTLAPQMACNGLRRRARRDRPVRRLACRTVRIE